MILLTDEMRALPEFEQMMDTEMNGVAVIIDLDVVTGRAVDMRR